LGGETAVGEGVQLPRWHQQAQPRPYRDYGWFIEACSGGLYGNGKYGDDKTGAYKQSDRVGVLLDLDNGSLRFFKNGVQHGPGFPAGSVTGPVVAAVQMGYTRDKSVRLLPNADVPANA
jgi:hypothetical protein